ncbi:MAG: DNA primase [bacterium]
MADELELEAIRSRISLVELVSAHTRLKKSGASHKGLCPFHREKTPSFTVNEEKGLWYCFGCGEGGNLFTFVMKTDNLDFGEAVEKLARQAGVPLKPRRETAREERSVRDRVLKVNERAARFFTRVLLEHPEGEPFLAYLDRRNVPRTQIDDFTLGASLASWDSLLKTLASEGYTVNDMEKAGLVVPRAEGEGCYDRFRGRLIFALKNVTGDVVGFAARTLGDEQPKYVNTPRTPVFDKGRLLYGIDKAARNVRDSTLIVTEGYMDVIALHREGIRNAVASMGTALTEHQVDALRRYCSRVALAYDADVAGDAAALRGIEMLIERDLDVRVVRLPDGQDPDGIVSRGGRTAFDQCLAGAKGYFEHFTERSIAARGADSPERQRDVIIEVADLIGRSPNPLLREHQVGILAERLGLDEKLVRSTISHAGRRKRRGPEPAAHEPPPLSGAVVAEKKLIQLLLFSPENAIKILDGLAPEHFAHAFYRDFFAYCVRHRDRHGSFDPDAFLAAVHPQEIVRVLSSVALMKGAPPEHGDVDGCVAHIRKLAKKRKMTEMVKKIEKAEKEGNTRLAIELAREASELHRRDA